MIQTKIQTPYLFQFRLHGRRCPLSTKKDRVSGFKVLGKPLQPFLQYTHKHTSRPTMSPRSELEVQTVLRYFDQLRVLNIHEIEKLLTDDFVYDTRPLSLGIQNKSKEEYLAFLKGLAKRLGGRPLEIIFYGVADASATAAKVFVHPQIRGEPRVGKPFDLESIYIFTFAENYKFKKIAVFEDSKAYPWARAERTSYFVDNPEDTMVEVHKAPCTSKL
ncbi:hypothetical protein EDB89DRAFT_571473 [Lactarius sanguifluus]|nr:hypothetical protein EDB89DRAFT_571473 [Lactarius sanguifluus]